MARTVWISRRFPISACAGNRAHFTLACTPRFFVSSAPDGRPTGDGSDLHPANAPFHRLVVLTAGCMVQQTGNAHSNLPHTRRYEQANTSLLPIRSTRNEQIDAGQDRFLPPLPVRPSSLSR